MNDVPPGTECDLPPMRQPYLLLVGSTDECHTIARILGYDRSLYKPVVPGHNMDQYLIGMRDTVVMLVHGWKKMNYEQIQRMQHICHGKGIPVVEMLR